MIFNMIAQGSTPDITHQHSRASVYSDTTMVGFELDTALPSKYRILGLEVYFSGGTAANSSYRFSSTHSNKVIDLLYIPDSTERNLTYSILYGSGSMQVTMFRVTGNAARSGSTTPTSYDYRVIGNSQINIYLPSGTPSFLTSGSYLGYHHLEVWYEEL